MKYNIKKIVWGLLNLFHLEYAIIFVIKKIIPLNIFLLKYGWSKHEDKYYFNTYEQISKKIIGAGINLKGTKILEIGCGNNILLGNFFINKSGVKKYISSDFYQHQKTNILQIDITDSNLNINDKYDIILSVALLEHITKEKMGQVFRNLNKLTKQGGYLVHQIDFRDHINFNRPFNNLKLNPLQWKKKVKGTIFYTNRLRLNDYLFYAKKNNFNPILIERTKFNNEKNYQSEEIYLDELYDKDVFLILQKE